VRITGASAIETSAYRKVSRTPRLGHDARVLSDGTAGRGTTARRIVLLGAPGSGKSTQAARLAASLGVLHIAVGDLLRAAEAGRTPLGREVSRYMDQGRLVPDEVVHGILAQRITPQVGRSGYVLDGYPRTAEQAEATEATGGPPDVVVHLRISDQEAVRRLAGRRYCPGGHVYHVDDAPSRLGERCELDGSPLIVRPDDREEVVRERLALYHRRIAPLTRGYARQGLLVEVDATGDADLIAARVLEQVGEASPSGEAES
jgi:adenylate kinase